MAQDFGDGYKEGRDFVIVDKGGYKTRRFLTKAEKAAMTGPKSRPKPAAKPAAAAPRASTAPSTSLRPRARPAAPTRTPNTPLPARAAGLATPPIPSRAAPAARPRPTVDTPTDYSRTDAMGNMYRKGGMVAKPKTMSAAMKKYEGSAADMKADKAGAKKMMGKPAAKGKMPAAKGKMPAFMTGKKGK